MTIPVDPDWWKSLFDEIYLLTDARTVGDPALTRSEVNVFCDLAALRPDHAILDLCGGHGRHSLELAARGYTACLVLDHSRVLLQAGRRRAARNQLKVQFVRGDALSLPMAAAVFDRVLIVGNSLGYQARAEADLSLLRESRRVLKPKGRVLVDVSDGRQIRKRFQSNSWHEIGADTVVCRQRELIADRVGVRELVLSKSKGLVRDRTYGMRLYTPAQLCELMRAAGYTAPEPCCDFAPYQVDGDLGFMNHRVLVSATRP